MANILYLYAGGGSSGDDMGQHSFAALPSPGDRIHIGSGHNVKRYRVQRVDHYPTQGEALNIGAPSAIVIVGPWRDK